MLSHTDKCIFVHIPKAAGQSVESVFVERLNLTWEQREALLLKPNLDRKKGPPRLAHLKASEYFNLGYISRDLFQQYYKFSFVRNPWARLVSEFNYRKSLGDIDRKLTFRSFLFETFPSDGADDYENSKDYYRHVIPQWEFLYSNEGECLVDFVGKFESLQEDFDVVCNKLSIGRIVLPHKNMTRNRSFLKRGLSKIGIGNTVTNRKEHYSAFYDEETIEFVRHYYRKDIELFGYEFERVR